SAGIPTLSLPDALPILLAGDALHSLAFEVLADPATHADGGVRCELARDLAIAVGAGGMAGGQMLDLLPQQEADFDGVIRLQRLKDRKSTRLNSSHVKIS